jgi:hypothetical protein
MSAAKFAAMSDEELFSPQTYWEGEADALKAEREKRRWIKEQEQARLRERLKVLQQGKDALSYSDALATEICERIASGELLTVICLDEHMPTVRRVNSWLREHTDFKALYDQSLQDRLNIFEEQIIQIPDEAARDFDEVKSKGCVRRVLDPGKLQAAKLRVEVRRRHLKALRPARWAEVSTLITKSDDFDTSSMSADELERQIAEIEHKSRVTRAA